MLIENYHHLFLDQILSKHWIRGGKSNKRDIPCGESCVATTVPGQLHVLQTSLEWRGCSWKLAAGWVQFFTSPYTQGGQSPYLLHWLYSPSASSLKSIELTSSALVNFSQITLFFQLSHCWCFHFHFSFSFPPLQFNTEYCVRISHLPTVPASSSLIIRALS